MSKTAAEVTLKGDHLVRATAREGRIRLLALRAEDTVRELVRLHDLSPMAAAAAGRLAMGAQLLSADLKNKKDSLTVIIRCSGPLRGMTMICDAAGRVRGTVIEPHPDTTEHYPGKLAVSQAVGEGQLTVIKDLGLREPYGGTVPLLSGEIAEDLAAYLLQSEQVPSVLALGVKMDREGITQAGGLLVQLMPGASEADLSYIESRARGGFPEVTFLLEEGFSPAQILDLFLGDPEMEYLDSYPICYHCPCSRERMKRNLLTLGEKDLHEIAEAENGAELCCHFCNEKYHFTREEIQELLREAKP